MLKTMPEKSGRTTREVVEELSADPAFARAWALEEAKAILASNVAVLRHERGWTQKELALAAGTRQPRIAEIENGAANPQYDTLVRIATALDVEVCDLVRRRREEVVKYAVAKVLPVSARYPDRAAWMGWDEGAVESSPTHRTSANAVNELFALNA